MKALIVYDSTYGNTEKIARAIGEAIGGDARVVRAGGADLPNTEAIGLLIVGSPTLGGRASPDIKGFLDRLPNSAVKDMKVAAFDTRFSTRWVGIFGYAAGKIASKLKEKGGNLVAPPEGFFVKAKEGPLKDGELERAGVWAKGLVGSVR